MVRMRVGGGEGVVESGIGLGVKVPTSNLDMGLTRT